MNPVDLEHRDSLSKGYRLARRTGFRPRLGPTVFTVFGVALLLGLGLWQVQRLYWKEGLIAARTAAVGAASVPAPQGVQPARGLEFHPVFAEGRFRNDKEILVHAISRRGAPGYDVWTPLVAPDGRAIFVDRGFVPTALADPATRSAGQIAGPVRVQGLLRLPVTAKPGWFRPANDPARGEWFWPDLRGMAARDGLAAVAPYTIDADAAANPGGWPKGGVTNLALPNHHLQYAITWFSLAVALLVIYVLSQRGERKRA